MTGGTLTLGKAVEIAMQGRQQGQETGSSATIFKGEITALEPEFGENEVSLTVRGYDKGHRLHRGKKTRTWLKSKDSDAVSKIAQEAGLTADADATSVTYDYLLQNNQTDWEFLQERARRLGYWLYYDGVTAKLYFKKASATMGTGPTLTWGDNLYTFSPRLSAVHQADKVTVNGWDAKKKEAITSSFTPTKPANQAGQTKAGGAAATTAYGGAAETFVVDDRVFSVDDAAAVAEGLAAQISQNFLWAEGTCQGDPNVTAGKVVTITLKAGEDQTEETNFGGNYLVTSATHIYDGTEYWVQFTITGADPNTLSGLLGVTPPAPAGIPGVVTGVVTDLNDPDKLGRVKVKFPWMAKDPAGTEIVSDWVRMSTPMAGAQHGLMILPEVNDEVLVAFEHGNPDYPFMIGALWGGIDKPPEGNDVATDGQGKVVHHLLKTRAGHQILLDDTANSELIKIVSKTGHTILLDDASGAGKINILSKAGATILLDDASGAELVKVVDKSGQNSIIISSAPPGSIKVESKSGDISLKGLNVTIEATASLGLKGATAKLEGSGTVDVKGGVGTFDGGGMATIKGGVVKIN
jgi:uncharacterized protein involved in type VI secretion and phage assembly